MTVLVHAGTLLAKASEEPLTKQTIAIENGRIASVSAGFTAAKRDDSIVDLSDAFVLSGLIDCHVHLTGEFGLRGSHWT